MACARRVVWRIVAAATLATGLSTVPVMAWHGGMPPAGGAMDGAPDAAFEIDRTEMPLDATRPLRAIPVRVNASVETDRLAEATSDDPAVLSIDRGGRVLPGQTRGYVLVRPVSVGETTVRVGGSALRVRVVAAEGAARVMVRGAAEATSPADVLTACLGPMGGAAGERINEDQVERWVSLPLA